MKPVNQTIIDKENGNCLQAAVASILELDLEEVPHFISIGEDWWFDFRDWLAKRNINVVWTPEFVPIGSWHIQSVLSSRFPGETHAVVANPDCEIVHDPNPDTDPFETEYESVGYYWFYPIDPALMIN